MIKGSLEGITRASNEATIRGRISAWLDANGVANTPEYEIGSWSADIHTMHRRCIVEVKRHARLGRGPDSPGSGSGAGETAYDQLRRYVERERGQSTLDDTRLAWRGFVTDGLRWWAYEWPLPGDSSEPRVLYGWNGREVDDKLLPDLLGLFTRSGEGAGKEWPPDDPGALFAASKESLDRLYERVRGKRSTKVQKNLWLEQLKGGGNHPRQDGDQDELFVAHTALTLVSRLISGARASGRGADRLLEGYVSWCSADAQILADMERIIGRYDWGANQGDLLRKLYSGMVGTRHRKTYGEYYTPDWLAEKICRDIIDDGYIREQIRRFRSGDPVKGVMDPACGSGTFLFHAGRRLMNSRPVQEARLGQDEVADFVLQMVCGMDIHPVAIEMALANMHRLLGKPGRSPPRVYQGDSLLIRHSEQAKTVDANFMELKDKDYLLLRTPAGSLMTLPLNFVRNHRNTVKFVKSAVSRQKFPRSVASGLTGEEAANLKRSHERLAEVAVKEGDGVWAWYIRNQAAPLLITKGEKMGRIVSNPPWVSNNDIQDPDRKKDLKNLGKSLGVYVGGSKATTFDLSSVFVLRSVALYLDPGCASGWVLPKTAISGGGQWKLLRKAVGDHLQFDWGNLAFPEHAESSTIMIGRRGTRRKLVKRRGQKIDNHDSWDEVMAKAAFEEGGDSFEPEKSAWLRKGKPLARNGATIYPPALVSVGSRGEPDGAGNVEVTTGESRHRPWSLASGQRGVVPSNWIRECAFARNLSAYCCPTSGEAILPIGDDGRWLEDRELNEFWRDACDYYARHGGRAEATPKTLEGNLDFSGKLSKQLGAEPSWLVLYAKSGSRMYAAVARSGTVVENTLYYVRCDSRREAWFLCGVLNSDAAQPALSFFKQAPRDYHTHFWHGVPIPRYDRGDRAHRALSKLAESASKISLDSSDARWGQQKARSEALKAVRESGLGREIDNLVAEILPRHARPARN